jgi:hypothetical protein
MIMFEAFRRTLTEAMDSKKAFYGYSAAIFASVLHLAFDVPINDALLLASPLGLLTAAQAHVDASTAKGKSHSTVNISPTNIQEGDKP